MINNIERNERFDLAYRFITETAENIFLTGKAGTGKTTFLKYLKEHCTKNILVAAPTGVAAINAGGITLHSLFQLPFHPFIPSKANRDALVAGIRFNRQRQQLLKKMDLLVIDEISMVRCDVMDAIDTILRSVRRNFDNPFGGVQLLCIGDLHQLPPVAQNHEWNLLQEYYASPFFFDSLAVKEQSPLLIELDTIYRQKDEYFVSLLNKVRTNNMTQEDFDLLNERFIPGFLPASDEKYITLTSHNKQADLINSSAMEKILAPAYTFKAVVEDDFAENLYPADGELVLKVGAQVMFLKNDNIQKRYFNGRIGTVVKLNRDKVVVQCDDDPEIEVTPDTWENTKYKVNPADGKLQQEVTGSFSQYPLRAAWAITIHKSQGLTFDKLMIDAASAFSSGQVYVALSRCTSLEGIVLLSKIPAAAVTSNDHVAKGQQTLTHRGSLADRFDGARQIFAQQLLEEIFTFRATLDAVALLKFHVDAHRQKLNSEASEWIRSLMVILTEQKLTGEKFMRQVATLMKDAPIIEENEGLQTRIIAGAANHFLIKIKNAAALVKDQPLITEHKEVSDIINEALVTSALALHAAEGNLEFCIKGFSVTSFLQHKLNYVQPRISMTSYAGSKKTSYSDSPNPELYEVLKQWRDMTCAENDIPIYMLVTHSGLKEICTALPRSKRELQLINGFGKIKAEKYGDDIIEAVESYCDRNNIPAGPAVKSKAKVAKAKTTSSTKPDTKKISFDLFRSGKTIQEVAESRALSKGTIEGHLLHYLEKNMLDADMLIPAEIRSRVFSLLKENAGKTLTEIKIENPDIEYASMRFAAAALKLAEQAV